jgi:3-methyladenine DNA glycosylase Tag
MDPVDLPAKRLWNAIRHELDRSLPAWMQVIERFDQVGAVERREAGATCSDDQVFKALLLATLSNSMDWAKVERLLPDLGAAFSGFSLAKYAETSEKEVEPRLLRWFKDQRAGSMTRKQGLMHLAKTARFLREWSTTHGEAENYFLTVLAECGGDPKQGAVALGTPGSSRKLPGLGIPLAAEGLRNMGYDVCKPDRHVCRAVGSFGLVQFRNWSDRTGTKAPNANASEMLGTMATVESLARGAGVRPTLFDTAIWLLCAQMGLRMSNAQLASLVVEW